MSASVQRVGGVVILKEVRGQFGQFHCYCGDYKDNRDLSTLRQRRRSSHMDRSDVVYSTGFPVPQ